MEYKEALKKIYNRIDGKNIIANPFLMFSYLSDLTTGSYQATKLVSLYYVLNREVNVIIMIEKEGIENTLKNLIPYYKKYCNQVDAIDFRLCVRGMVEIFKPDYFKDNPIIGKVGNQVSINNNLIAVKNEMRSNYLTGNGTKKIECCKKTNASNQIKNGKTNGISVEGSNQKRSICALPLRLNETYFLDFKSIEKIEIHSQCAKVSVTQDGLNCLMLKENKGPIEQKIQFLYNKDKINKTVRIDVSDLGNTKTQMDMTLIFHCDLTKISLISIFSNKKVSFCGNCKNIRLESDLDINFLEV